MQDQIIDVEAREVDKNSNVKTLYLAIGERQDGETIYGTLHDTWDQAEKSAVEMCREINSHMKEWRVRPTVMDLEYLPDEAV